jgi:uncharacterized SAM-binding protein YcdF (DUF218 family)
MTLILSKFLPPLLFPVGLTVILCLVAVWLAFRARAWGAAICALLAAGVLYAGASPLLTAKLLRALEARNPPRAECVEAPAIVLLGGGMASAVPPRLHPETNAAGDRVIHAARLWKRGCAPRIVATGGYISFLTDAKGSEADLYAALLTELFGVPSKAILRVGGSKTTFDDAVLSARLFDSTGMKKEILLVTSASHMPRAAALFRRQGFAVTPEPTDFQAPKETGFKLHDVLPSAEALRGNAVALNEYLGTWVYGLLGRL